MKKAIVIGFGVLIAVAGILAIGAQPRASPLLKF